jgi:hypothetical protein
LLPSISRISVMMNASRSARSSGLSRISWDFLRAMHGGIHPFGQPLARGRETGEHGAAVVRAAPPLQQAAPLQPIEHVGDVGAVDAELAAERVLVEVWIDLQRAEQAVLHRRDVEACAFLEEQRVVNLMQPPQQVAGPRP